MIETINFSRFCDGFSDNYKNKFSYEGKRALFDYLEDYEEDTGEQLEYDPVAFCCDYTEYTNFDELKEWHKKNREEEKSRSRLEYLRGEIQAERISYGEIAELQSLAKYIDKGDVELLEWAGVPEFGKIKTNKTPKKIIDKLCFDDCIFTSLLKAEKYFRKFGSGNADLIAVDGILYTMEEYDKNGTEISYHNMRTGNTIILRTENRYTKGFKDAKLELLENYGISRNDITYYD